MTNVLKIVQINCELPPGLIACISVALSADEPVLCLHRYIVLTTSAGIMDHEEARRKHTGGKILGFFF